MGIGVVWALLQLIYIEYSGGSLSLDSSTIIYGVSSAIFVTLSNILLLECMSFFPISFASTVCRLNTIPLVVLAFFLDEEISLLRSVGIVFGLLTVFLLYRPLDFGEKLISKNLIFTILIVLACVLRALYGLFIKAGISNGADANTMILLGAVGWFRGGILLTQYREKRLNLRWKSLNSYVSEGCLYSQLYGF